MTNEALATHQDALTSVVFYFSIIMNYALNKRPLDPSSPAIPRSDSGSGSSGAEDANNRPGWHKTTSSVVTQKRPLLSSGCYG